MKWFGYDFNKALLIFLILTGPALGATGLGRFVGTLEHSRLKKEQLVKLDFISSRENGNELELMAVLTLHFGDFKSQEYIAFHFDKVRYNILSNNLVFDQVDQDATLIVDFFNGSKLTGRFRSALGGDVGTLKLEKEGVTVTPTLPLIESVWGEYQGTCEGKDTKIQLFSSRSSDDIAKATNPFATYKVRAFRARKDSGCALTGETYCTDGVYDAGEFNFYKNELILFGRPQPIRCSQENGDLKCDGCLLKRISGEISANRQMTPVTHEDKELGEVVTVPALVSPTDSIQGEYLGYLYHEYLDLYQPVSVNLVTYQEAAAGGSTLKMSAVATLYFGKGSTETVSYRFDIRNYPNPIGAMQFVFARPEADIDAALQVTTLGKGEMKGTWFSQLFGRVGKFSLRKNEYPILPAGAKIMEPIQGLFESSTWNLDLYVRPEENGKTPANTENPFFPRSFDGGFTMSNGATPRLRIIGGSYDFYTGRIALETVNRMAVGQRDSQKKLALRWVSTIYYSPLLPFELEPFRYTSK